MPEENDPDEYIKQHGKENFLALLKEKQVIQSYIWNYHLQKIDRNNPFEVSRFEKEIKKLCYSIKDETLKKYVLEDFLEKIKKLTPIQSSRKPSQRFQKFVKNQNYQILNETKNLHQKKSHFSKIQIKEFSVLFIMLNYINVASKKIEDIARINFFSEKNEGLKKLIISSILNRDEKNTITIKTQSEYKALINEINENSSIHIILESKNEETILELLNELIVELEELNNLRKIESLEKDLINNLDENSYSELLKLKSQLNRD
jgi:DNA primase